MKMRKAIVAFLAAICIFASVCTFGVFAEGTSQVYAETNASVEQGSYGYCYVYLDDLTDLASLNVAVHYDTEKVTVTDSYNQVACSLYDSSNQNGCLQYSYIFDGEGSNAKTNLFYFCYQVNENAEVGSTYFDIVVTDAYNTAIESVNIGGSRCNFTITEKAVAKIVDIYGSSNIETSVKEEFEISYSLGDWQIASGSMVISYDPDLFEFVEITNGEFLDGKLVDVNTSLDGSVYLSFLATEYNYYRTDLLKIKFRTLKNVTETSEIKLTVSELYDLSLNRIVCNGCTTNVGITHDATYTEDSPSVSLSASYNAQTDKITVTIKLDKDSHLGAGDFVLNFDTNYLTYSSVQKGFSPSFFNINNKNVGDGILKFSIISLVDITDEQVVLTVVFDVKHACEDKLVALEISGSGLADSLTNPILLNFVDASVTVPLKHTAATATTDNHVEPTCTSDGRYDSVVYCSVCDTELSRETKTVDKLGHDHSTEWTADVEPTCTTNGSKSHHCSRCDNQADVTVIPANGHSFGDWYTITAPTCTTTGTDEHECSVCQYTETKTTNALGHTASTAVEENRVEPTCTINGSYDSVVYCSVCNAELSREAKAINKLGHDHSAEWTVDIKPTCTTEGSKSHHCSRCGDKADITAIPANGHFYGDWYVTNEPTESVQGEKRRDCSNCSAYETSAIAVLEHDHSRWETIILEAKAPTCTLSGLTQGSKCSKCGEILIPQNTIAANGHNYGDWYTVTAPTCTATGTDEHECSVCHNKETRTTEAKGHTNAEAVVENKVNATCTADGSHDSVIYCSICKVEVSREAKIDPMLRHDYESEWTTDVEPTCTTVGSKSHHCTECGDKVDVTELSIIPHPYGEWYEITAPTCTTSGVDEHKCSVCQHTETKETTALGHKEANAVEENKNAATCTSDGSYDSVIYCLICGEELSRETKTIDKLGHDHSTEWTLDVEPTCTTTGSKSHHCSRCDNQADVTVIPANGHSFGDWYTITSPTCTATGTDEHECSVCQYTETKTINALGHTASTAVAENRVEPTCTVNGSYDSVVYCSVCDAELSRENKVIDKLGHDHSTEWTVDVEPTCTTTGSKSHHCSRCDNQADVTVIPANGHSFGDWYTITSPTCTATGTDEHECSVCQYTETKTINALGHTAATAVEEKRIEPTCTVNGSYDSVVYCSVCNAELSRENKAIDKLGHDHSTEWTVDIKPTCTTEGSKSHHCSRCDNKADITAIPANGHSYGDWYTTTAPTCVLTGVDEHECSVCHHKETKTTNALGHTASAAVVENRVDPTCTTNGGYDSVIYCSICNAELSRETKTIDKLGHNYSTEWTVDLKPTCTTEGSKSHHCSRCGDKVDITVIPANGHSYGEWYETHAPTCIAAGTDEHECSVCHNKETRTTDAKGHTNSEAVVENKIDATCTTDGSYDSVIYCSVCKVEVSRETKTNPMLGHDYSNEWTTDVEPTCTTVGSKSHHCTRCDDKSDVTEISANGHSYLTDFVFDEANHWKECACGEKSDTAVHTWDNGVVTKEATVDEEGTKAYTCTYCSHTKFESISKIIVNIEDADSGVTLEIPSNSQATLPAGTVIDVVDKSNEQVSDEILGELATTEETIVETLGVYDLNLMLDGVKIQPNGAVVVTLPAPKLTKEYDRIVVVYIAPDGSYEECKTTVNANGTISFETDHFSKYAVIGINEEEAKDGFGTGAIIAIIIGALLVAGAGGFAIYWFVIKKKVKLTEEIATDKVDASADAVNKEQQ